MGESVIADQLRCRPCEWYNTSGQDRRCMIHGHQHAVFKCDSCCSIATWNCTNHHYCERCHADPWSSKSYPCPGPDKCPLGIAHPPNVAANLQVARGQNIMHASFVIGCAACLGVSDLAQGGLHYSDKNQFGFPQRDWATFADGAELLTALGQDEVRARLRHVRLPHKGIAIECAERLFFYERGIRTPEELLAASGRECTPLLSVQRRLAAMRLATEGRPLELARRLLLLRVQPLKLLLKRRSLLQASGGHDELQDEETHAALTVDRSSDAATLCPSADFNLGGAPLRRGLRRRVFMKRRISKTELQPGPDTSQYMREKRVKKRPTDGIARGWQQEHTASTLDQVV